MHREILKIYHRASAQTKAVYNEGHDTEVCEEENWVIRWLLWHAFRYRDQRNNKRRTSTLAGVTSGEEDGCCDGTSRISPSGQGDPEDGAGNGEEIFGRSFPVHVGTQPTNSRS